MVEVVATDEFVAWYQELKTDDANAVDRYVKLLGEKGTSLGYPYSSAIKGTEAAIRELRAQSQGQPLRVFYSFDSTRDAVLILGGDKTGNKNFYEEMIPVVEKIWKQYLAEHAAGLHEEK